MNVKTKIMLATVATVLMAVVTGCTSTTVVDPPKDYADKGETITLNIACPDAHSATRADTDHVLRFTVVMYVGSNVDPGQQQERREIIASSAEAEQVIFQVPEGTYTFVIIGDYLPNTNVENKKSGPYQDAYYDTSLEDGKIYMNSFCELKKDTYTQFDSNCINNDNYECFAAKTKIEKTEEKIEKEIVLKRIVSKISFVSDTDLPENIEIENLTFSEIDFLYHYNFTNDLAGSHASGKIGTLPQTEFKVLSSKAGEVMFYFYSFGLPNNYNDNDLKLSKIEYKINYKNGDFNPVKIQDKKITPIANYIITVKGSFLAPKPKELGDIILNLSLNNEWDHQTSE